MSMTINKELPNPAALKAEFPVPEHIKEIKAARDKEIAAVFRGESDKFLVIVGPC
ncbi:MAG TPA: 3-deoxy-7-phosphoheptulonate synthase, partial [Ruminococcaceae bacterium]|nr:3-deoxy-7-phosphoheptulonate synthase [Oscillospiraceae bacterium]